MKHNTILLPNFEADVDEFGNDICVARVRNVRLKEIVSILEEQGFVIIFI